MKLPVKVVKFGNNVITGLKKNSPKILFGIGIAASIGAFVEAIHETPKAIDALEDHKEIVKKCKEDLDSGKKVVTTDDLEIIEYEYGPKEYKKDIFSTYVKTGGKLIKIYGPALALEAIAITSFVFNEKIINDENKFLTSALEASVGGAIADRNKVREAIGEEAADRIFNGTTEEKITEEIVDEDGKKKKVTKKITVVDPNNFSNDYDILWMDGDPCWDPSPELRVYQVSRIADYFNKILYEDELVKTVSLNDVRKYFKKPDEAFVEIGQIAGWDKNSDDHKIILRTREVSIPDPENPNFYHDAVIISPNISGSIVKSFVK
jgi:hypothetical protein